MTRQMPPQRLNVASVNFEATEAGAGGCPCTAPANMREGVRLNIREGVWGNQ